MGRSTRATGPFFFAASGREQRCGALDCHGQVGRPLRLYSASGLRKNTGAKGARDTRPTQPDELLDNYFSVVGLEPEDVTATFVTGLVNGSASFSGILYCSNSSRRCTS